MRASRWLNCIVVALWLFVASRGRAWLSVTRSVSLSGYIPHAGVFVPLENGDYMLIEYVPQEHRRKSGLFDWAGKDWFFAFEGVFRVTRLAAASTTERCALPASVIREVRARRDHTLRSTRHERPAP